jgi:hypothetical protein
VRSASASPPLVYPGDCKEASRRLWIRKTVAFRPRSLKNELGFSDLVVRLLTSDKSPRHSANPIVALLVSNGQTGSNSQLSITDALPLTEKHGFLRVKKERAKEFRYMNLIFNATNSGTYLYTQRMRNTKAEEMERGKNKEQKSAYRDHSRIAPGWSAISLGFKNFDYAAITIAGVELLHCIRKGQFALHRLRLKDRAAAAIWNAVLAA